MIGALGAPPRRCRVALHDGCAHHKGHTLTSLGPY